MKLKIIYFGIWLRFPRLMLAGKSLKFKKIDLFNMFWTKKKILF